MRPDGGDFKRTRVGKLILDYAFSSLAGQEMASVLVSVFEAMDPMAYTDITIVSTCLLKSFALTEILIVPAT